eukprot:GHVO01052655.1.p1 GENE.GHVO01052655.1~~GHVO01052655.1.p1  ORF type:complete len:459 (+),score=37.87 GHVO01052655.1:44-1420(+)
MNYDWSIHSIGLTVILDAIVLLVSVLIFAFVRETRGDRPMFSNRRYRRMRSVDTTASVRISDYMLIDDASFPSKDVSQYMRFLRLMTVLFGIMTILDLSVILPCNLTASTHIQAIGTPQIQTPPPVDILGTKVLPDPLTVTDVPNNNTSWRAFGNVNSEQNFLSRAAATNINRYGYRIWILYGCTWITSIIAFIMIYRYNIYFKISRELYTGPLDAPNEFTIMLSQLDVADDRNSISDFFSVYSDTILSVHVPTPTPHTHERRILGLSLPLLHTTPTITDKNIGVAFITFSQTSTVRHLLANPPPQYRTSAAPHPDDIIWKNVSIGIFERIIRVAFWSLFLILVTATVTSSVIITDTLTPIYAAIDLAPSGVIRTSLLAWTPPLVLLAINSYLLPYLVSVLANNSCVWKKSSKSRIIIHCNVFFLVINTVLFPILGSTVKLVWCRIPLLVRDWLRWYQ